MAASFLGGRKWIFLRLGGGKDSGGISRPGDGMKHFHLVTPLDNITINQRPRWREQNRPGDRVAASFLGGGKSIFLRLGEVG